MYSRLIEFVLLGLLGWSIAVFVVVMISLFVIMRMVA